MTKDEQIEQLEMEKRVLIGKLVKAQNFMRNLTEKARIQHDPALKALSDEAEKLYLELRG